MIIRSQSKMERMANSIYVMPNDNDVLCGRGLQNFKHPANQSLRHTIALHLDQYKKCAKRSGKTAIIRSVVRQVFDHGGRFLKFDSDAKAWYACDMAASRLRVGVAFRDATDPTKATFTANLKRDTATALKAARAESNDDCDDDNDSQSQSASENASMFSLILAITAVNNTAASSSSSSSGQQADITRMPQSPSAVVPGSSMQEISSDSSEEPPACPFKDERPTRQITHEQRQQASKEPETTDAIIWSDKTRRSVKTTCCHSIGNLGLKAANISEGDNDDTNDSNGRIFSSILVETSRCLVKALCTPPSSCAALPKEHERAIKDIRSNKINTISPKDEDHDDFDNNSISSLESIFSEACLDSIDGIENSWESLTDTDDHHYIL